MDWFRLIELNAFRSKKLANASPNGLQSIPLLRRPKRPGADRCYVTRDNVVAAERMGNQLLDAALSLATFPKRGRMVPEFRRPQLREIVFRSYRIIYRVNSADNSLEIVRSWHGARGFPQIPRSR
jgi:toxin ParE1/3/4